MTNVPLNFEYQVGGSLGSNAPSYVTRQADSVLYQALKAGEFCYILNSRQMGKSSLRVRTMQRLTVEGTICVFIDLSGIGRQDITPEQWYAGIVQSLVSSSQLQTKIQWRAWWRERRDVLSPVQRLCSFIKEVLLVELTQNIVIFVDEIDRVLNQDFSLDDFFVMIRYLFEQRNIDAEFKRLTFALLGVATPSQLIQDKTQTPFNIGKAIELHGFEGHEVQPLIEGLKGKVNHPEVILQEILDWTGGQPFLTQKLCQLIVAESAAGKFSSVKQVVRSHLVDNWEYQDEPEHLRTIRDRVLSNQQQVGYLLGLYQVIWQQNGIPVDNSSEQLELRLSGLVVEKRGQLFVHNRICEAIFDNTWIEQELARVRPYATAIKAWLASNGQDESCLLRGEALQNALTWALGKRLSDSDYQFLNTSQDLAKREALIALQAIEQASELLAKARHNAKQKMLRHPIILRWIPLIAIGVTVPILLLRLGGLLQGLEWNVLDQFFRWRPSEVLDDRIVIVTVDESDIAQLGHWPISDRELAKALNHIKAQTPQAIGLDIYRDLPVEPGHGELIKVFRTTPNLFGIEKVVNTKVSPPPILSERQQVGFSDQVLDADGKIRRALLSVRLSDNEVRYSLAVKLALHYLESKEITLEPQDQEGQRVHLGQAVFERFRGNDGGYVRASSGGYQILLNYRGPQGNFVSFSLTEALNNQIPADKLRDRIILIGTTAESIKDLFYTPYSSQLFHSPQSTAGVTIHAQIVRQILNSALDGWPLLRTWGEPLEWLWILVWGGIGAGIGWRLKTGRAIAASLLLASGGLVGVCYLAFIIGWWLPIVPCFLALLWAGITLSSIANRQQDKLLFRNTLNQLLEMRHAYPTAGQIAIEYLKQSETQENQALIEQAMQLEAKRLR